MTLAFVVLFSTVSFTVEKHYCCKMLVDIAILSEVQDCGMNLSSSSTTSNSDEIQKEPCCKNVKTVIEGQDELKNTFDSLELEQQWFVQAFTYSYLELFQFKVERLHNHTTYLPPLLIKDIQVLDETYLI